MTKIQEARMRWIRMLFDKAKERGMTHQQIADNAKMKRENVSKMLSGKYNITLENYIKLANAIGLKI